MKSLISILFTLTLSILFIASNERNNLVLDSKKLDANSISTWFRNNGSFNAGFEWPRGSGKHARYASGVFIGARVGNDTIVSGAEYSSDFLPGYTDNNGVPHGQEDPLYRVYKLILGVNNQDRANWPNALLGNSDQGAPVYFDSQTNSWKPLDFGHQTLFYRFTDSYSTTPLKADVMRIDFAVDLPGGLEDAAFSQFTVINKNTVTWNNTYITIWTDDDLGYAMDDKVGCDSARNLGYTYNGTNNDPVYGAAPPAVGFVMLRGGLLYTGNINDTVYLCRNKTRTFITRYKDLKMSAFSWYENSNDPINGNPVSDKEFYRYMSGDRRNGSPTINPIGNYRTKFCFSGDPVTAQGWVQGIMTDQRFMMSTGPINIAPGDTQVIVVAQVIARGSSNLNSITALRQLTEVVKNYYNTCYTSPPIGIEPISNEIPNKFVLYQNYPNPFNPKTKIKFQVPKSEKVTIEIYDLLGNKLKTLVNDELNAGSYEIEFDGTNYASGVYYYKLTAKDFTETKKMIMTK